MKKRWYFDLDHTLYDTDALIKLVWNALVAQGSTLEEVEAAREKLRDVGYTYEGHLALLGCPSEDLARCAEELRARFPGGNELLLPNVTQVLRQIAQTDECNLLTFGNPDFQRAKFDAVTELHPLIRDQHYVWRNQSKGEVLRAAGEHIPTYFVDDSPRQLLDAAEKAPWVHRIRMRWSHLKTEPHPEDDKSWKVVRSIEELLNLTF